MEKIIKPRGTMDILPDKVAAWQYIEKTAREISAKYGFGENYKRGKTEDYDRAIDSLRELRAAVGSLIG